MLFNDIHTARRIKFTPGQGVSVAMEKTNEANGLTRDLQGRIVSAEHVTRRVTRYEPDGSVTVIANSFGGKRLLRPNDVIVKSDGAIYFTDPGGNAAPDQWDVTVSGVYRVSPDLGTMSLIVDDMVGPTASPSRPTRTFSTSPTRGAATCAPTTCCRTVRSPSRRAASSPISAAPSPVCRTASRSTRRAIFIAAARGGLYIMDSKGKKLGRIVHGQPATTNVAFGGDDWSTLYFTTSPRSSRST